MRKVAMAAFLVFANCPCGFARDECSLTNFESRPPVIPGEYKSLPYPEVAPLQERVLILEETIHSLTETVVSLAVKKEEAEKQLAEINLSSSGANLDRLELIKELKHLNNENMRLKSLAQQTSEVLVLASENGLFTSPPIRAEVEKCLRDMSSIFVSANLGRKESVGVEILHIDSSKSLLVLNAGSNKELKIGLPIEVFRGEQCQARATIIEVRKNISAAVIQSYLQSDSKPQPGDLVKIKI